MSSRARAVEQTFEKIFRLAIDKRRPFGYDRFMDTNRTCRITETHCENCGRTGPENLGNAETEGYTQCCNELETYAGACRGFHLEDAR